MKKIILFALLLITSGCASNHQILVGAGFAYVPVVPVNQMTGHEQFHISIEYIIPVGDRVEIKTAWHHFSNGAQIGIGRFPNYGFDAIGTSIVLKLF